MNLREKIEFLMNQRGITKISDLSNSLDIPYSTMNNIMHRDKFDNVKFSILEKLCNYFNVDLHYLVNDDITDASYKKINSTHDSNNALSPDELQLISMYRTLNDQGKEHILICATSAQALFKEKSSDISVVEGNA